MSGYEIMLTTTYVSISEEIAKVWEFCKAEHKNETIEDQIHSLKYYYANHENFDLYFNFDISSQAEILLAQRYIVQKIQYNGRKMMSMSELKQLFNKSKLKHLLLFYIIEDFVKQNCKLPKKTIEKRMYVSENCDGCRRKTNDCKNSSNPCYKCDNRCDHTIRSNDDCIRICEACYLP
jgi:hypothetical protein